MLHPSRQWYGQAIGGYLKMFGRGVRQPGNGSSDASSLGAASTDEVASAVRVQVPQAARSSDGTRRETGLLAAGITAVPLLVASGISVIPQLSGVWPTAVGIAVLAVVTLVVGIQIARSARRLLVGESADAAIVRYTDNRETGILLKGTIENVSLRVRTIHNIVDTLTSAIPPDLRQDALYKCGCTIGKSWASDFRRELPRLEIERTDVFHQLLKWSEYDATAGMGRLTVAVNPATGDGVITLNNGFLSRHPSRFPLNWWFAGYLAGTLHELLDHPTRVAVVDPTNHSSTTVLFQVMPESRIPPGVKPRRRPVDPRSVARGQVWWQRLRTPLPREMV